MPQKTRFESVPLEVVKKVVEKEIEQVKEMTKPDQETKLAELKRLEKLLVANKTSDRTRNGRKA